MIYLELFWAFFKIGLFSFGGGYAALPLIQGAVVSGKEWLTMAQFTDLLTISQMTPGPIALNASTFVGTQVAGLLGAIVATLGCVTPSCIIILILAKLYYKYKNLNAMQNILFGLRPAVVSLIAAAGVDILFSALGIGSTLDFMAIGIFAAAFLALRIWKLSPILIISLSGAVSLAIHIIKNFI